MSTTGSRRARSPGRGAGRADNQGREGGPERQHADHVADHEGHGGRPTTDVAPGAWVTIRGSRLDGFDGLNVFTADLRQHGTTLTLSHYTTSTAGWASPDPRAETMSALFARPSVEASLTDGCLELASDRTRAAFVASAP